MGRNKHFYVIVILFALYSQACKKSSSNTAANCNLISIKSSDGIETRISYDNNNKVTNWDHTTSAIYEKEIFEYDSFGILIKVKEFDDSQRLTYYTTFDYSGNHITASHTYDYHNGKYEEYYRYVFAYNGNILVADTFITFYDGPTYPIYNYYKLFTFDSRGNNIRTMEYDYDKPTKKYDFSIWYEFEYDNKINPLKGIFFYDFSEKFYSVNNIAKVTTKDSNGKIIGYLSFNNSYNSNGYISQYTDGGGTTSYIYNCK
jgi:hypothetical protein